MKIISVDIPKELINNGLLPVKMDRLGQVVLLAGKNGSGKSRLLGLIEQIFGQKIKKSQIEAQFNAIKIYERHIADAEDALKSFNRLDKERYRANIRQHEDNILRSHESITNSRKIIDWNFIQTDILSDENKITRFVPKKLEIVDPKKNNKKDNEAYAKNINKAGMENIHAGAFNKIQQLQDRWFNATHQHSTIQEEQKQAIIEEYETLKKIIKHFLNVELDRNADGDATLFWISVRGSKII